MVFGSMIGWLASLTERDIGALQSTIIGGVGAALGGVIFHRRFAVDDTFDLGGIAAAMLASVLLVIAATRVARSR